MLRTIGTVEERRTSETLDTLDRRLVPRRKLIEVDFGSTPVASATARIGGLSWVTTEHCFSFGLTTQAQATAKMHIAVTSIDPGKAIEVFCASSSNFTGIQRFCLVSV